MCSCVESAWSRDSSYMCIRSPLGLARIMRACKARKALEITWSELKTQCGDRPGTLIDQHEIAVLRGLSMKSVLRLSMWQTRSILRHVKRCVNTSDLCVRVSILPGKTWKHEILRDFLYLEKSGNFREILLGFRDLFDNFVLILSISRVNYLFKIYYECIFMF